MLVFLRAEKGRSRFEVPTGKDQPFMFTDQSLGSEKFANRLYLRKRGAPAGGANLPCLARRGTILGPKFISNSVFSTAIEKCFSRSQVHQHAKDYYFQFKGLCTLTSNYLVDKTA